MDNYDNSIICDYITLWLGDADNHPQSDMNRGKAVWDIPPNAYYFKDRGSVCLMSIVDANIEDSADNTVVLTQSGFNSSTAEIYGGVNPFVRNIQDLGVLGCFINNYAFTGNNYETKYNSPEVIKVLTPARPRTIKLYFYDENKAIVNFSTPAKGCITIKFEYVKPELLEDNIHSMEYKPAF